jgi:hypothetical protein
MLFRANDTTREVSLGLDVLTMCPNRIGRIRRPVFPSVLSTQWSETLVVGSKCIRVPVLMNAEAAPVC